MKAKTVALIGVLSALANVMSLPPLAIPLPLGPFTSAIHFFQLAVFLCAIFAGPWAGFLSGAVGSLYMGITKIPFLLGGIALLGACTGLFAKKFNPVIACLLAWIVQIPYILVTDYVWLTYFLRTSSAATLEIISAFLLNLGLQAFVCAMFAGIIVHFVKRHKVML